MSNYTFEHRQKLPHFFATQHPVKLLILQGYISFTNNLKKFLIHLSQFIAFIYPNGINTYGYRIR